MLKIEMSSSTVNASNVNIIYIYINQYVLYIKLLSFYHFLVAIVYLLVMGLLIKRLVN